MVPRVSRPVLGPVCQAFALDTLKSSRRPFPISKAKLDAVRPIEEGDWTNRAVSEPSSPCLELSEADIAETSRMCSD
jgi:hypothetical protein